MYRTLFKRLFDVAAAIAALILLSPLMLVIAILIRTMDPGPVIFVQQRVGRGGRLFQFFKFRSMPCGTPELTSDRINELKITAIGRFIRRTNIDELPQLANVLNGDMSLVGPRPPIASQHELIELRRASGALDCRPGLTGLAQVRSFDNMSVAEKAAFDAEYANRVSLAGDLDIMLRTVGYLLKPPPKY
jgi:O-antigen biosynthesis protein WbqP